MIAIVLSPKTSRLIEKFANTASDSFNKQIAKGVRKTAEFGQRKARGFAPRKTSRLYGSIDLMKQSDNSYIIGTNLVYARIHEFGGTIRAKNAPNLKFKINGKWITKKEVHIPKFRGRGYFNPAFNLAKPFGKITMEKEIGEFITNISK